MFGIKTKIIKYFEDRLEQELLNEKPLSRIESKIFDSLIRKKLQQDASAVDVQCPVISMTNPIASKTISISSDFMPNNLGNWLVKEPYSFTTRLEKNLIEAIKKYYHCGREVIGHFGSGSTEGNIYAAWIGRNYLLKNLEAGNENVALRSSEKIILLKSSLAHYSMNKAADLIGIRLEEVSIDPERFAIDEEQLAETIERLYKEGLRGFLLPVTLGYTVSGTDDSLENILNLITSIESKYKSCKFFVWIDASFSGISKIYTEEAFRPFQHKSVQLITTDFHKFLAVPYPSSMFLYRKKLLRYIEKTIPYIDQMDTTLLGSRPGNAVLITWMTLRNLGRQKIVDTIARSLQKKNTFLKNVKISVPSVTVINYKNSFQACLITSDSKSEQLLRKKYNLEKIEYSLKVGKKFKKINLYKLYFLPNFR